MAFIRKILHVDLDAFFCAVEENRDPDLRGKAFAVGGRPDERGVVASCSYAARAVGVRSAMPMSRALKLCPELLIIPGHYHQYRQASSQVMAKIRQRHARCAGLIIVMSVFAIASVPCSSAGEFTER